MKDLIAARLSAGGKILFDATDVAVHDVGSETPRITFRDGGEDNELTCDILAGCDGFHGICRQAIPAAVLSVFERVYPFAWLGILAEVPPLLAALAARALAPAARVVVEHASRDAAPVIAGLTARWNRAYGDTAMTLYDRDDR